MPIKLTKRESDIYDQVMLGYSNIELADMFCMGKTSMARHLGRIYAKKGCNTRAELMAQEIMRLCNEIRLMEMERD